MSLPDSSRKEADHKRATRQDTSLRPKYVENAIIKADARDLTRHIKPDSVTLTVTSPPYRNAIDYGQHVSNLTSSKQEWMRGTGGDTTEDYLQTMKEIFDQVFQVTKKGGRCCIVIGDEVVNGKLIPLPSLLLSRLVNSENEDDPNLWNFRDMIIWNKVTSGRNGSGNRFGVFVQYPYADYFRVNIMHEYILVLQKGRPDHDYSAQDDADKIPLNKILKRELCNSIWNIAPVPPNSINHPAPFPESIPWRLATLYTKPDDLILDPMNGSGQTTKVAHNMGRRYLGFDLRKEYVAGAKLRLNQELRISGHLFPVFYKSAWSQDAETGFFDTTEANLSANIPPGYKFVFKTESDKIIRGKQGVYTYYVKESNYLCFIIESNGKHSRLNMGSIEARGSMLYNVLLKLPAGPFVKKDLNETIPEPHIVNKHQSIKACIDVLEFTGHITKTETEGKEQYFEITSKDASARDGLKDYM